MDSQTANPEPRHATDAAMVGLQPPSVEAAKMAVAASVPPPVVPPPRVRVTRSLIRSLIAVIVGSLILRLASHATGQMLQTYFDRIDKEYYHLSYTLTAFINASFYIAELLGALVFGALSDRYGRRRFIMLGPLLGLIAVQLTSLTVVVWLLVITRVLEGLSTASSVPATLGYLSEATVGRPALRARIIGFFEITLVGGIAMGASVGGYLSSTFDHPIRFAGVEIINPAFSINGLIYLFSLIVFAWGLKDLKRKPHAQASNGAGQWSHYRKVLKSRMVWMFIPAWLGIFSIIGVWINNGVRLLTGHRHREGQLLMGHISTVAYGNGLAILAVIFALGILAWSFILARYRRTSVMLLATGGLFVLVATVYGMNHLESFYYPLMALLLISVVVLSGFTPAALTFLADVTEGYTEERGSIMGLYSVFLGIGQLLGSTTGGYFADWQGIDGLLLLSAIFGAITLISLIALRRLHPQEIMGVKVRADAQGAVSE